MALLEVDDLHTYYGSIHALRGISLDRGRGRDRDAHRRQRRRQDDHAQHHQRAAAAAQRARSPSTAGTSPRCRSHDVVTLGVVQVPEGRRVFARLTIEENLRMGAYSVNDKAAVAAGIERAYTMFPRLKERARPGGRHPLRRRAADAGHGPGAHGHATHPAPGRALHGPRAQPRGAHLRDHRGHPSRRARPSCSWSRTPARRWPSPTAATCCRRAASSWPTRRPAWPPTRTCAAPTSARSDADRRPARRRRRARGHVRRGSRSEG